MEKKTCGLFIGYVPLFYSGSSTSLIESTDAVDEIMNQVNNAMGDVHVKGLGFISANNELIVIFVTTGKAKELVDHINWYSDGQPQNMFKIYFKHNEVAYACALLVDIDAIIERLKKRADIVFDPEKSSIIFRHFGVASFLENSTYSEIKDLLKPGETIKVAIANAEDIIDKMSGNPTEEEIRTHINIIGEIEIGNNEYADNILDGYIKNEEDNKTQESGSAENGVPPTPDAKIHLN